MYSAPKLGLRPHGKNITSQRSPAIDENGISAPKLPVMGWALLRCITIDFDDSICKCPRGLLRQVMADAAGDGPVRVLAGEFIAIGCGVRVRCPIGITFKGYCGDVDH